MKYQFVLQWDAASISDFDSLMEAEEFLSENLSELHMVDGHDMGCGEFNIFVLTDAPKTAFSEIKDLWRVQENLASARIAYRKVLTDTFVVLWPHDLSEFKIA